MNPRVAIAADFLKSFALLPRKIQKKARQFTEKFRRDPTQASINYEKLRNVRDAKVRTVRIGSDYRAVVIHPPKGDVYICVWVAHHDEAMAWAENKLFEVNPLVGSLQVFDMHEAASLLPAAEAPAEAPPGLFAACSDAELVLCGVPELLLPSLRALHSDAELDRLAPHLPAEAADALYLLAAGGSVQEALSEAERGRETPKPVDVDDFAAALEHPDSQRRFAVVASEDALFAMLRAPLERWRVFLHPTQRRIVSMQAQGPVRVLGGAGTGKTVVLMHRARHLAQNVFKQPQDRLLVTTFTKNLASDIRENLRTLCGPELERIEVVHLHGWASDFLRGQGLRLKTVSDERRRQLWEQAYDQGAARPLEFYQDEWKYVVQAQDVLRRDAYLRARRVGRGTALNRKARVAVWTVLQRYRAQLEQAGLVEVEDLIRETRLYLEQQPELLQYRAVLADEVQDLREADLRLLRSLVPPGPDDLFLVGDAHQRIYGHKCTLGHCGIDVRGARGRRLKVNYRTTEGIRDWAVAVLQGVQVDDLDGGLDNLQGYRSLRPGPPPRVYHFARAEAESAKVLEVVQGWLEEVGPDKGHELCVAARTRKLRDRYAAILSEAGIACTTIQRDTAALPRGAVRLATMHRLKGLEFPRVLLAAVQAGQMPLNPPHSLPDEASRRDWQIQERCLLYVASTRARDELVLCGFGERSPFLPA